MIQHIPMNIAESEDFEELIDRAFVERDDIELVVVFGMTDDIYSMSEERGMSVRERVTGDTITNRYVVVVNAIRHAIPGVAVLLTTPDVIDLTWYNKTRSVFPNRSNDYQWKWNQQSKQAMRAIRQSSDHFSGKVDQRVRVIKLRELLHSHERRSRDVGRALDDEMDFPPGDHRIYKDGYVIKKDGPIARRFREAFEKMIYITTPNKAERVAAARVLREQAEEKRRAQMAELIRQEEMLKQSRKSRSRSNTSYRQVEYKYRGYDGSRERDVEEESSQRVVTYEPNRGRSQHRRQEEGDSSSQQRTVVYEPNRGRSQYRRRDDDDRSVREVSCRSRTVSMDRQDLRVVLNNTTQMDYAGAVQRNHRVPQQQQQPKQNTNSPQQRV